MSATARYLVTGGAGFIGSHIVAALLRGGHEAVVLDDLSTGKQTNLDEVLATAGHAEGAAGLTMIRGSLLEPDSLAAAIEGAAAVFHQAAIPSVPRSFAEPVGTLRANVEGTARLLEACREAGVRRIVYASSSSVYGDTPALPKDESMAPAPLSPYALSKLAGERLCRIWAAEHGLEAIALRYFNVFGPRQDPASQYAAVIPKFVSRMLAGERPVIFGDGTQSRDFTYVDNVVTANLHAAGLRVETLDAATPDASGAAAPAALHAAPAASDTGDPWLLWQRRPDAGDKPDGLIANVATGDRHTLLDLVAELNRTLGTELEPVFTEPRPGDVRHSQAAIDRAREYLRYEPAVGFEQGLRRTVAWFESRLAIR